MKFAALGAVICSRVRPFACRDPRGTEWRAYVPGWGCFCWRRVMVWVHGGGMMVGDSSMDYSRLVATQRVVLVNVNYRLGPLGFLSSPELEAENGGRGSGGMNGQHDVIVALQWVARNIGK